MPKSVMRIGELARLAGVATSALRYYDEAGLLGPSGRTEAGYRLYGSEAIGRLEFVQRAKALGLSLREVRELLATPGADGPSGRDRVRHVVAHKLSETRRRIDQLQTLELELKSLYVRLLRERGQECGHIGDCGCWLPTEEEVIVMASEIACCDEQCCPACACTKGESCDCADCACGQP